MTDTASLVIRVDALEAKKAQTELKGLESQGKKTERATDGMARSFSKMLGPLAAMVSVTAGLRKTLNVAREFDVLNAQLVTATGGADNAALAFQAIQDFASTTPYDLAQVTDGFTKLVNLGLTPSEAALTSYGNTASAMGKDLNQLIEAVADASTGEFERLKEFGIKSKSEGDKVSFTFRGVTTTVGKNAAEIEGFLQGLGNNEFAGAMVARMDTLDGAMSNLGDEWDKLFLNISEQGVGDIMESSVRLAVDALEEINAMLASGELEGHILNIRQSFSDWETDISNLQATIGPIFDGIGADSEGLADKIDGDFGHLPANIRSFVQLMTVELASFVDKMGAYGTEIKENLFFWQDETFDLDARLAAIDDARKNGITSITDENMAVNKRYDEEKEKIEIVRQEYDKLQETRRASGEDSLAQFKAGPEIEADDTKADDKGQKALERLEAQLASEEQAIQDSYLKRLDIIVANTELGSTKQNELLVKAAEDRNQKIKALDDASNAEKIATADDTLGMLATLQKSGSKEGMAIAKGAAVAQATMKTYESAQNAYASLSGIPYVGPALGAAAAGAAIAAGMQNIAQIKSAGSFAMGGIVGGNSPTGDGLTANVNSGEMILNKQQQASLFNQANGGGGGQSPVNLQVNNLLDVASLADAIGETEEFKESVLNVISVNEGEGK